MRKTRRPFSTAIFDTETTSLIQNTLIPLARQPHIIEFYGCRINEKSHIIEEVEFQCKPPEPITEEITKITGLTNEDLLNARPFNAYLGDVKNFFLRADEVVAHNLSFDMLMVNNEFARRSELIVWPRLRICTVENTEHLMGKRLTLSALHEYLFGEKFTGAHRARVDVSALARCFMELRKRKLL